jgi:hypothetical protein
LTSPEAETREVRSALTFHGDLHRLFSPLALQVEQDDDGDNEQNTENKEESFLRRKKFFSAMVSVLAVCQFRLIYSTLSGKKVFLGLPGPVDTKPGRK